MRTTSTRLGVVWLALAAPVGVFGFLLSRLSDHADERRAGDVMILLAASSVALAIALLQFDRPSLRRMSLVLSGLWVGTAVAVVVVADFLGDQLWGGGVTLFVAAVTAAMALTGREPAVRRRGR